MQNAMSLALSNAGVIPAQAPQVVGTGDTPKTENTGAQEVTASVAEPVTNDKTIFKDRQITVGGNTVTLLEKFKSDGVTAVGNTVVSMVEWEGGKWTWVKESFPKYTTGRYLLVDDNHLIVVIVANEIVDIYDLAKIHKYVKIGKSATGPMYDGRDEKVTSVIALKKRLARELKVGFKFTPSEAAVNDMLLDKVKEERNAKVAAREAKMAAEKAERTARNNEVRERIFARPRLKGHAGAGLDRFFNGSPVVGDEWMKCPGDTFCVSVASYDDATKTHGEILGCFIVKKDGAKKRKTNEDQFTLKGEAEQKVVVKALGEIIYVEKGEPTRATLYGNKADATTLRHAGLKGGTVVAVKTGEEKKFDLYTVTGSKVSLKASAVNGTAFLLQQ